MAKQVDINGYWSIKDNPLTKAGVFQYLGKQIDPSGKKWGLDPERIYMVYRSLDEISRPETLKSFEGVPFIDEHEMLGEGCTPTDLKNIGGSIYGVHVDGDKMVATFKIYSDEIKDEIRNGKKELSLGYRADFERRPGFFDGKSYDFVQTGILGNHVALVKCGRCGSDVRIFDKAIVCDSIPINKEMEMDKLKELKAVLDSMDPETLVAAKEYLAKEVVKDGCSAEDGCSATEDESKEKGDKEDKTEKGKAEDEADKKPDAAQSDKKDAEDEAADKAEDEKAKAEDEAAAAKAQEVKDEAIRNEARKSLREAIKLHDRLVPHIGEFCMDEMFSPEQVAKYGCEKLNLNVNAGSEIATLTGYLAGCKGSEAGKVVTVDEGIKPKAKFDFKAAYLAKK